MPAILNIKLCRIERMKGIENIMAIIYLILGNDRTPQIEVRPDGRTSSPWVRPDAGPDRTGSSSRTYHRTVTGPITEPRPDPETGQTSDNVLGWFP